MLAFIGENLLSIWLIVEFYFKFLISGYYFLAFNLLPLGVFYIPYKFYIHGANLGEQNGWWDMNNEGDWI